MTYVGHKFSLVLSRQITDEESGILRESGFADATFATDSLPTNADVAVTKIDFDDAAAPSLAEAIESALETVKKVPDLTVPGLTVPAVPQAADEDARVVVGEVVEGSAAEKAPAKKRSKKASAADKA
ncbi:hypothetical protein ACH41H_23590 [Streptomyces sp. NPDC020800]|uniref:hypothetical protein n=1 Tax=Streptomyces sp. NPDC020800 TaxID=3365092 RepID=UPI0037AC1193